MKTIEVKLPHIGKEEFDKIISSYDNWKQTNITTYHWENIVKQDRSIFRIITRNLNLDSYNIRIVVSERIPTREPSSRPHIRNFERFTKVFDFYEINIIQIKSSQSLNESEQSTSDGYKYEISLKLNQILNEDNIIKLVEESKKFISQSKISIFSRINSILGFDLKFSSNHPITLNYNHLTKKILDYGVTLKADGVRHFLFLDDTGAYLIGKEISKISNESFPTELYDVEVMKNNDIYIIDKMIDDGKNISNLTLDERYKRFKEFEIEDNTFDYDRIYVLKIKEILFSNSVEGFFSNLELLDSKSKTFETDGFIFTPISFYGSSSPLKWKPLSQLTIDVRYRRDGLYVMDKGKEVKFNFTSDMSEIESYGLNGGDIVEISYDNSNDQDKFHVFRIRKDRTVPNEIKNVKQIYSQLRDPITFDDITSKSLTLVRKYHNRVKHSIYEFLYMFGISKILDVGSGRGGDIKKWKEYNFSVIGIEPNKSNIRELRKRILEQDLSHKIKTFEGGMLNFLHHDKTDAVTFFNSITFFSPNEILNFINDHLLRNGIAIIMGMDGKKVKQNYPRNYVGDYYSIRYISKDTISINITGSIVSEQEENLFNFDELYNMINVSNINSKFSTSNISNTNISNEFQILRDFYFDDGLLSEEGLKFSECYRCLIVWRKPSRITRDISIIDPFNIVKISNSVFGKNAIKIGIIEDGSYLFHAILMAIRDDYIKADRSTKKIMVSNLRNRIISFFDLNEYKKFNDIVKLSSINENYKFQNVKRRLQDYNYRIPEEFINFVSNTIGINIFTIGDLWNVKVKAFRDDRPSIIILNSTFHELLGFYQDGKIQVLFPSGNQIPLILNYI